MCHLVRSPGCWAFTSLPLAWRGRGASKNKLGLDGYQGDPRQQTFSATCWWCASINLSYISSSWLAGCAPALLAGSAATKPYVPRKNTIPSAIFMPVRRTSRNGRDALYGVPAYKLVNCMHAFRCGHLRFLQNISDRLSPMKNLKAPPRLLQVYHLIFSINT